MARARRKMPRAQRPVPEWGTATVSAPVRCVGPFERVERPMTDGECRALIDGACWRKARYGALIAARSAAALATARVGAKLSPYRCPFSSHASEPHWHVGHPPTMAQVERLALAVRHVHEHPDLAH